jgi:hypothetical protein
MLRRTLYIRQYTDCKRNREILREYITSMEEIIRSLIIHKKRLSASTAMSNGR